MRIICLAFWIGINLIMRVIAMTMVDYDLIYFSTGETLTLSCNCKVSFWNGPVVTHLGDGTSPVKITDIYGNLKVLKVSIYMQGGTLAKTLSKKLFKRLNVVGDNFDLQITNLSTSDEGLYICELNEFCFIQQKRYLLQHKLLPSKLEILNVTRDTNVNGKENCPLNLVCLVERGKPPAVLRWRKNGTIIRHGGSNRLVYTFVPDKTDHQSIYKCEAQNPDMKKPLSKSIHLNIKYKPFVKINVSSYLTVVEGEIAHICCISRSNPKPTSISWHKEDEKLVSTFSNSSLCYRMGNVSRYDTGNYTCSSQNEIGDASSEISLIISYPPVITIRYRNLTEYSIKREIRCIAQGEPNTYNYFTWEHQSLFKEHIRYLDETDDGILRLPEINVSNIYQDTGFYICNVSNWIPDYRGNVFQLGRAYYLVSIGPPVFSGDNKRIQDYNKESAVEIKVKVYSPSEIICHNITEVGSMLVRLQYMEVRMEHILMKESFHDAIVTVNGIEIIFVLNGPNSCGSCQFNVTVCNSYGQSSFVVELKPVVNYSSDEKTLSLDMLEGIIITIIAFLVTIVVLVAGMAIYVRYLKQMYRKRIIAATNIQSPELFGDESSHYADIIEDDNILALSQGTNTQMFSTNDTIHVVVENRDISHVSDEISSSISDNDINASDILDDGYEKPYSSLVEIDIGEIKHVYLSTTNNLTYENARSDNTACGHSPGFTELDSSPDKSKTQLDENDCQENVKLNYVENCSNERDFQQPYVYRQQNQVEYINLSLKQ